MANPNYRRAVLAAYKMRAEYDCGRVWFDPFILPTVEKRLKVCRFSTFCEMHGIDYNEFMRIVPSTDGFTLRRKRQYIIVYNDAPYISEARRRFTLAHELGHYTLSHRVNGDKQEEEANCFARNLLAPRKVAIEKGIDFSSYPEVFGISATAARMCEQKRELDEQYLSDLLDTFSDK